MNIHTLKRHSINNKNGFPRCTTKSLPPKSNVQCSKFALLYWCISLRDGAGPYHNTPFLYRIQTMMYNMHAKSEHVQKKKKKHRLNYLHRMKMGRVNVGLLCTPLLKSCLIRHHSLCWSEIRWEVSSKSVACQFKRELMKVSTVWKSGLGRRGPMLVDPTWNPY